MDEDKEEEQKDEEEKAKNKNTQNQKGRRMRRRVRTPGNKTYGRNGGLGTHRYRRTVQRNPWSSKSKGREALGHSHGVQGKTRQGRRNFTPNTLKARTHPIDGRPYRRATSNKPYEIYKARGGLPVDRVARR